MTRAAEPDVEARLQRVSATPVFFISFLPNGL